MDTPSNSSGSSPIPTPVPRPRPAPPTDEEREGYYYGLPSRPRLVARTNTDPWAPQFETADCHSREIGKCLDPVGKHPMVDLWNKGGSIQKHILEALRTIDWTSIDILRIGYAWLDGSTPSPVTFLISVVSNSTEFEQAHDAASRCRDIIKQHGIDDVHVEMKESRFLPLL